MIRSVRTSTIATAFDQNQLSLLPKQHLSSPLEQSTFGGRAAPLSTERLFFPKHQPQLREPRRTDEQPTSKIRPTRNGTPVQVSHF
jgi:hypothetical protein